MSALPDRLVIVGPRHQPREQSFYPCRDTGQVFSEDGETAKGSAVEKCWYCSTSRPVCEDDYTHRLACGSLPMPWQTDDHYTQIWRRYSCPLPTEPASRERLPRPTGRRWTEWRAQTAWAAREPYQRTTSTRRRRDRARRRWPDHRRSNLAHRRVHVVPLGETRGRRGDLEMAVGSK